MYTWSAALAVLGGESPQRSSIRRSVETTRLAFSRSNASTARCLRRPEVDLGSVAVRGQAPEQLEPNPFEPLATAPDDRRAFTA